MKSIFLFLSFILIPISVKAEKGCTESHELGTNQNLEHLSTTNRAIQQQLMTLSNCLSLDKYSCLYRKSDESKEPLIIYFRGHWGDYRGKVPLEKRNHSLEQAIKFYDLSSIQNRVKSPLLVSSSSHVGFTINEIDSYLNIAGFPKDSNIILASHSGGNVGLIKTLNYLKSSSYKFKISKIIMLDNFYFQKEGTPLIKEFISRGAKCSGYFTSHNKERFKERFLSDISSEQCKVIEKKSHNRTVNKCLENFILSNECDLEI